MTKPLFAHLRWALFAVFFVPLLGCSGTESSGPVATTDGPLAFRKGCGRCHLPPNPKAHGANEWPGVVARMQTHMATQGKAPLTAEQRAEILEYLTSHALGAS